MSRAIGDFSVFGFIAPPEIRPQLESMLCAPGALILKRRGHPKCRTFAFLKSPIDTPSTLPLHGNL
jgi:hypothetical protein